MIEYLRTHRHILIVLVGFLLIYLCFPLQLQSGEPYNYASAIEGYYRNSIGFSLAQGENLPDFGRYHPNHPIGHALAGLVYDWLKIPALLWVEIVNTIAALAAAGALYLLMLNMHFLRIVSALSCATFLATYCGLFTVVSGEWHMPALAMSLAGLHFIFRYIDDGKKQDIFYASLLFAIGTCYHLAAIFYLVPVGIVILFLRPLKERWKELFIAGLVILSMLLVVYVIIPFILFQFKSKEEFLRTFLVYKYLTHIRYSGLEWLIITGRTILHTIAYTPARLNSVDVVVLAHLAILSYCCWKFVSHNANRSKKLIILITPAWWLMVHWIFGARPDAMLGWLFVLPLLSMILIGALAGIHRKAILPLSALPILLLGWNLSWGILPNSLSRVENIFYFHLPEGTPKSVPIAFVTGNPLLMESEIWYAGSKLGYRNQRHFLPCCGEYDYLARLKGWTKANPGFLLVSDGRDAIIENLLRSQGLHYKRWTDRRADWPSSLVPTTLYVQHTAPPVYGKRLTIWIPENILR